MDIRKGDRVRITIGSTWREGAVISADNWGGERRGQPDDWYIELATDKGGGGGPLQSYGYWKQGQDGGTVQVVPAPAERDPGDKYQVWYFPLVQPVRILEDRKAETKEFGTRLVLKVLTEDYGAVLFSVLSTLLGPNDSHVEELRSEEVLGEGSWRLDEETEKAYLKAWGF